jgi:hypothetical protein
MDLTPVDTFDVRGSKMGPGAGGGAQNAFRDSYRRATFWKIAKSECVGSESFFVKYPKPDVFSEVIAAACAPS